MAKILIVTGLGRSGTKFISSAANGIADVHAVHEPRRSDRVLPLVSSDFQHREATADYLSTCLSAARRGHNFYVEANSYLRHNIAELLPLTDVDVITITRHPATWIQSAYSRPLFSNLDPIATFVPNDDEYRRIGWGSMDRFERLCWYWSYCNEQFLESGVAHFRHEDLLDPLSVQQLVCERFGLPLPEASVHERTSRLATNRRRRSTGIRALDRVRRLSTSNETLAEFARWSPDQKAIYFRHCALVARKVGYSVTAS